MPAGRAVSRMSIPLMSSLMSNKVIIQRHMARLGQGWKPSKQGRCVWGVWGKSSGTTALALKGPKAPLGLSLIK